ncbi:MAG: Fe-S cluster assembly protein SufD [Dehalococcoidia bacterium]|jgi:Fe-S cluster assembly protein SufD|nr:Fe-S cluster assembly protein SufD [Dehalococcoidia bacterium]|tara:strand:- start:13958 stop:15295 length:1338 start_codon:yes stop_codon:yes gene_type:complete
MSIQEIPNTKPYITVYNDVVSNIDKTTSQLILSAKKKAFDNLMDSGFPTHRKGNEDWKYTDVNKILQNEYKLFENSFKTPNNLESISSELPSYKSDNYLVFINGVFQQSLSQTSNDSIIIDSLKNSLDLHSSLITPHLENLSNAEDPFMNFNTALFEDGVFIYLPKNTNPSKPIQIINIEYNDSQKNHFVISPLILVVIDEGSYINLEEYCLGSESSSNLINTTTRFVLSKSSKLNYSRFQNYSKDTNNINNTVAILEQNSTFNSFYLDFGGQIVRNNLNVELLGEESTANLLGLYLPNTNQHVDNQVIVDHKSPYSYSDQTYKGILNGNAQSVFHGSIIVREKSIKVDAAQEDKNLLLSSEAEAYTKPAFWIYCDDVMCKHGAACGQIDEESLFYLTSRGISSTVAKQLLVRGFVGDVLGRIESDTNNKNYIEKQIENRLDNWL